MLEEASERFAVAHPKQQEAPLTAMCLQQLREQLSKLDQQHLLAMLPNSSLVVLQQLLSRVIEHSYHPELVAVVQRFCLRNSLHAKLPRVERSRFFEREFLPKPADLYAGLATSNRLTYMKPVPEKFHEVLASIEAMNGMVPNLQTLLMHFPSYLKDSHLLTHLLVESSHNPLEPTTLSMLAVMAVSTYGCMYLFRRFAKLFLEQGGNPEWLRGKLPPRLEIIKRINCKLAYSPWSILKEDFQSLLQHYSLRQLTYIVVLLAHFQSMACIAMANGIIPEEDTKLEQEFVKFGELGEYAFWNPKQTGHIKHEQSHPKVLTLAELADQIEQQQAKTTPPSYVEQNRYSDSDSPDYMKAIDKQIKSLHLYQLINKAFQQFLDPEQKVERFNYNTYKPLRCVDFSLQPGVFVWLQEQDAEMSVLVSNLIEHTKSMTNELIGQKKECSTAALRQAIRFYYENLCGYHHQHYDYKQKMTNFLSKQLRFYLKVTTIYPFLMQQAVLRNIPHQDCVLSYLDTTHISLLAISKLCIKAATKFELTLVWAIRALKAAAN